MKGDDNTRSFAVLHKGTSVNQYEIIDKIGAGGMGEVYLAEDTKLKREVALKFLPAHLCWDTNLTLRFIREAEATAKLNHPNVITIHDVDEYKGRPFFAMELVKGLSLRKYATDKDPSLTQIVDLAMQICQGLAAAHDKQIVHRDIKPANIVVDSQGRAKILDFGLATIRNEENITKTGSTLGTIRYMSPEQVRGEQVDHRSDLYSLGVVLYELIAGRPPFLKENDAATLRAIVDEQCEPLSRFKSGVPQALETLVEKLLEKQPDMRYQSASGVIADLKRVDREMTGATGPATPLPRLQEEHKSKTPRRSRVIVPGSVIMALIIAILIFQPWTISIKPSQEAQATPDNSMAALYFENVADPDDTQNLERMMLSLLITDLSTTGQIKVLSRQRLFDIVGSLGEEPGALLDPSLARKVSQTANVKWVLTGEILQIEPQYVVTAEISDPISGTILASQSVQGKTDDDVFAVVDELGAQVLSSFSSRQGSEPADAEPGDNMPLSAVTTTSAEAYNLYLDGLDLKRKFYTTDAYESLSEAVRTDSTFAMAYLALSSMSSPDANRKAIENAYRYIDRVTPRERLWILATRAKLADPPKYDEAIAHLEELIEKFPEDLDAYTELAALASSLGDYQRSVEYLEHALKVDPNFKNAHNEISYAYYRIGEMDKAFWAANEYVKLAPNEANPYDTRGDLYARTGQFDKAVADFRKALEIKPGFFSSKRKLINACILNRDFDVHNFACQLFLDSEFKSCRSGARWSRGLALEAQGKFAEADEAYRQGIGADKLDDATDMGWFFRKFIRRIKIDLWINKNPTVTPEVLDEQAVKDSLPYSMIYRIYYDILKDDFATAADHLQDLIEHDASEDRHDENLYAYVRWLAAFKSEDYAAAVEYGKKSLEYDSTFKARARLGISFVLNNQPEEAVEYLTIDDWDDFVEYVDRPILFGLSHYYLGRAYEQSGWANKAAEMYEKFLDLWGDGDRDIDEVEDARARLAQLSA
jgi:serine/threonine protein kinase/tetratricopeptide (TPR) repeat protein